MNVLHSLKKVSRSYNRQGLYYWVASYNSGMNIEYK